MKRSEMIEIIAEAIVGCPIEDSCEEMGEIILKAIEKAGMLPPKAQIPIQVNGSEAFITDYVWEKE